MDDNSNNVENDEVIGSDDSQKRDVLDNVQDAQKIGDDIKNIKDKIEENKSSKKDSKDLNAKSVEPKSKVTKPSRPKSSISESPQKFSSSGIGKKATRGKADKAALSALKREGVERMATRAGAEGIGALLGGMGLGPSIMIFIGTFAAIAAVVLLVGIVVSLIYIPGSTGELVKGFFKELGDYFFGEDKMLGDKEFSRTANVIQNRGYDLYAEGYINEKLEPSNFNEDGEIISLPDKIKDKKFPHLIELYARMDAYTYRIRNKSIISSIFTKQDMRGLLNFRVGTWDDNELATDENFFQGVFREAIKTDRNLGTLYIKRNMFGGTYTFQMDGWPGKYGLPLELFVALHQGTRSPDLVREIAKGTKAYTDEACTVESVDVFDQLDNNDVLYYKKPILNILLLKTDIKTTVNFLVPETTTVNGTVYLLNRDIEIGKEYDTNPYIFTKDDFIPVQEVKSEEEKHRAFFRTESGQYVQISPKKSTSSSLNKSGSLNSDGTPVFNLVEEIEKTKNGETTTKYKVKKGDYDFSSVYFGKDGKINDLRGEVVKKGRWGKKHAFIDEYGLYNVVADVSSKNAEVNNSEDFYNKLNTIFGETGKVKTYIPMIKNSENHWFRDVYFYLDQGEEYVLEDKDYYLLTGEKWSKYNISEEDGKKILTPEMETIKENQWSAYEIKTTEKNDGLGEPLESEEGDGYEGFSDYVYIHENQSITATQKQEGRRGMTNARTKNLFTNIEWYKYDGSVERADENNEDRKKAKSEQNSSLKSLVEADTDLTAAFEVLEGSNSIDAQYILRDLKELYVELGYFEKEDLRDPVRRVLRWPLSEYKTPKFWPSAEIHQDPEGYGVFVPSKATLEEIYDEEEIKENKQTHGEGFEEDINVLSPVTGKIEEIGTKDIERLITDKDGELKKVVYKDVGYITISAIDATAPKEADPYKDFYETEYKGVISGKEKHGKQKEDSRYIKGNKITIEGIKVEIPSDVNNKENSSYVKQIKSSDLKKIQDEETRKEAEAIEQAKVDAPNYISISGSENHIGDYIKEGTIIGKTTESDLRIIMRDVDKAFIENVDEYIVLTPGFYIEIMDDYYTKTEDGEPNIIDDVDLFKEILEGFPILQEHAQELLNMQEKYEVNAIYAAAVSVIECGGGNAGYGLDFDIRQQYGGEYNNIFSIQGNYGGGIMYDTGIKDANGNGIGAVSWDLYDTYNTAFEQFAELMHGDYYWGDNRYFVNEIAPHYCDDKWGLAVNKQITTFLNKASLKLYGTTGGGYYGDASGAARSVIEEAYSHLGKPYVWGAIGPNTFDCSGLVWYIYKTTLGLVPNLYRVAADQFLNAPVKGRDYSEVIPGDLVFFNNGTDAVASHVGIYIGDNQMIHAANPTAGVILSDMNAYLPSFIGWGRYLFD